MAKELLERRVEEEKKVVTLKLPVSDVTLLDSYAAWVNHERAEVVSALIKTLLESRGFAHRLDNGSNVKGKGLMQSLREGEDAAKGK